MSLTLTITDESLQQAFEAHLIGLLKPGEYYNPVKRVMDDLLGYNGSMKDEVTKHVTALLRTTIEAPNFVDRLSQAIVNELARREADKIQEKLKGSR